jgi:small subunit ribosomal protein S7
MVPKPVDVTSQRKVDLALLFIAHGSEKCAFKTRRSIEQCLADEIINAAKNKKCHSINKKEEKERMARAAR